ncbi:hypothetical protein D3C74_414610 [compost metagenome]
MVCLDTDATALAAHLAFLVVVVMFALSARWGWFFHGASWLVDAMNINYSIH